MKEAKVWRENPREIPRATRQICKRAESFLSRHLLEALRELPLVREAFPQLAVELLHALPQLVPVASDLGQAGLDAGRLARRNEPCQILGVGLQSGENPSTLLELRLHNLKTW